jgi:hypothetical protein
MLTEKGWADEVSKIVYKQRTTDGQCNTVPNSTLLTLTLWLYPVVLSFGFFSLLNRSPALRYGPTQPLHGLPAEALGLLTSCKPALLRGGGSYWHGRASCKVVHPVFVAYV